jgi:hypothetical protein
MKYRILVLAAMLFFSACEKENENGKQKLEFNIQGHVVEMESQAPVPGVELKLYSGIRGGLWIEVGSAITYDTGFFQILYNLLYGDTALFTFVGLNPKYTKVRINGGATSNIDEYFSYVVSSGGYYKIELIQE